jgi:glycosyltransferase involved in cell wall biosynthesis
LNRLLGEQKPDLLQSFLFHANVISAFSGWRMKIPRIVLGMRVADRSPWRMMLERIAARIADRVVCVSESVATLARDEVRVPANKLCVIPNGVDVSQFPSSTRFDFAELGVPGGRRVIVAVGRLHRQKGLDWLIQLAPRFLGEVSDVDLVIVGQGPEELALRQLAESLGLAQRIHFAGWRPDVPAILHGSSLLVLPSRWEGMPNVVLEAMATGLPVVATQTEGVAELLGPLADQQSVRFGDDRLFAERVASVLRDPQRARCLGEQNRARIEGEFSVEHMVSRYEDLYRELLESR